MEAKNILITTGGTGGHIFPAIVLGNYLHEKKYNVLIVGDERSENQISKISINNRIIKSNYKLLSIKSLKDILFGIYQSFKIIKNFKPNMIIGFGGYATLPILLVAKIKKIPFYLHEQNSYMGRINRFFLKNAKYIFTSFQEMYGMNINYSDKIVFTGNPVRKDIKKYYNNEYKYPEDNENFNILITGGSGGASFFSNGLKETFSFLNKKLKSKIYVFHQVKEDEELDCVKQFYVKENIKSNVSKFFDDMPELIAKSHLIIARSGVGTASEISVIGRPVIFIPSPNVVHNHQIYNANFYKRSNACIIIDENNFIASDFAQTLTILINNKNELESLAKNIKKLAIIDAEETIEKYL